MRPLHLIGVALLVLGARGVGYDQGRQGYDKFEAIAQDNKRTGELALRALDRAWLVCATPFNQFNQDDDRPRTIRLKP